MYFKQFFLGCLAHASYLIADQDSKKAVVVDPQRDIDQYIEEAKAHNFEITHVILTHFHADFLAGHLEFREKLGAHIMIGAQGAAEYEFEPCKDGQKISLGKNVRLEILETPGHTPEGISVVVYDLSKNADAPWAVLTGDTLFVGDVGRPDLLASVGFSSEQLASMLWDSLQDKLLKLPDETLVYPAHGAGSMCGKNIGKESFSTIGKERKFNISLQAKNKEEFIANVSSCQPEAPQYFIMNATLNKQERQVLSQHLERALTSMTIDQLLELKKTGPVQILDARSPADFSKGHLKGSINIGLGGNYASWAGTVLDHKNPIVLIANSGSEEEAALRLGRIGYDNVVGFVEGGASSFLFRQDLLQKTSRVTAQELNSLMQEGNPPLIIDVRSTQEWTDKHIDGAMHFPLNKLNEQVKQIPTGRKLILHCLGGYRSMIAASILEANGYEDLTDLVGGINAWTDASLPVVRPSASCAG